MTRKAQGNGGGYRLLLIRGGVILMSLHAACLLNAQYGFDCITPDDPGPMQMGPGACGTAVKYTPDASSGYQNTPNLVFKVNYHFFRPTDGSGPYAGNMATHVEAEVNGINYYNGLLLPPTIPVSPAAEELTDARVRFELSGIYYHDDDAWYAIPPVDCDPTFQTPFGVDVDHTINIFYYTCSSAGSSGCGPGPFVNMRNCFPDFDQSLIRHELGHVIGLPHTYICSGSSCFDDVFSDTYTPDCNTGWTNCGVNEPWTQAQGSGCTAIGTGVTNNVMGYNACRRYYSPMQLAEVHRRSITTQSWRDRVSCTPSVHNPTMVIAQSATWEASKIINANLVIEPGVVLDVRCTLYMSPHAKIIVKEGAKLIVDGGTLTAHSGGCNDFWPGIEVWGDNAHNQFPGSQPTYQGMVVLKNGAIIEHAREAITMQHPGVWGTFGGIVQATDASFLNCRRSVEFLAYQNTSPGGSPISNRSFFKNCLFSVDDDYRGGNDFATHVSMWKVDGVNFIGCTFENLQQSITDSDERGMGITSIDASYRVLPKCDVLVGHGQPCPSGDTHPCVFRDLDHGIHATNSLWSASAFSVGQAEFDNNVCGVYANGVVGFRVRNSKFVLGNSTATALTHLDEDTWFDYHRGLFSTECWASAIDDNELEQDGNAQHLKTEGIVVGYTWESNDVVFRNTATGLERAFIGEGVCADIVSTGDAYIKGLVFLCNENNGNERDFWSRKVDPDPIFLPEYHTIRTSQGTSIRPADNMFDQEDGTLDGSDFYVDTEYGMIDYWHRGSGLYEPVDFTPAPGMQALDVTFIPQNNCAGKVAMTIPYDPDYPSGMAPGPVMEYMLEEKLAYGNTRYLYDELIDAGSTDAVVQEIQSTWPSEAWQLHDYLMGLSPHLSVDALKQMVSSGILPDAMVTEILVANPEATRADGFITWLQERSGHPLPEYMLGMVVASWDQHSYRGALEDEMAFHHGEMTQAATLLIHHYQALPISEDDTTAMRLDSIRWVWRQLRTPAARYAEALTWLQELEFDSAAAAIDRISEEHVLKVLGEAEQQRMLDLIAFMSAVYADDRTEMQLDSVEVQELMTLMDSSYDRPATWISNLLCFGYNVCRPPLTGGEDGEPKVLPYAQWPTGIGRTQPLLKLHPNPANTWVALDYDLLAPPKDAVLLVRDIMGREVFRIVLQDQQRQIVWDTRATTPGSYTVVLLNGGRQIRAEKLVIQQ